MTQERRQQELEFLTRRYGEVDYGPNLDWVLLKQLQLPHGWNCPLAEVLIIIPPGYPMTPPDNFYVRNGILLADGRLPNNYSANQSLLGSSWGQFSFHAERWNPTPGIIDGDNLVTFMMAVERRLQETN